ncbi:MAG TPA: aldehyde dehydrogenase [Rhizobiaceae bacterium]|nr:aldehyde dehydrogenase [Rhizobiaceae bacterium]
MTKTYTRDYWQGEFDRLKPRTGIFIDGRLRDAADGGRFERVRPMDGQVGYEIARGTGKDIDAAVASAKRAFDDRRWRDKLPADRKAVMLRWAALVREHAEELALLETLDAGKPISDTLNVDTRSCANTLQFYGEMIDKLNDEIMPTGPDDRALVVKEPLGVIGAVTPWNYPLIIDAWKLGPAIAAGNSVVLKPSELTPLGALRLAELAVEAGIPEGVFNVVPGFGHDAGATLASHNDVAMLAFTGSTATGRRIMAAAAESNMKRVALELGGKSPVIVFDDADLDAAANAIAWGIFYNSGETCHAPSRIVAAKKVQDELVERVAAVVKTMRQDHPLDPATQIGALIEEKHLDKVMGYIAKGRAEGASLRLGGGRALESTGGFYVEPTIFADAKNSMAIARDEIFGPVLTMIPFAEESEAEQIAGDTIYGLAAAVFTKDMTRAHRLSRSIQAGTVWVNGYDLSNISTPFGGFKQSGFGRDRSIHAIDKYMDYKTIWQRFL